MCTTTFSFTMVHLIEYFVSLSCVYVAKQSFILQHSVPTIVGENDLTFSQVVGTV